MAHGMDSTGKIKPESKNDGSTVTKNVPITAMVWLFATLDIKSPSPMEQKINKKVKIKKAEKPPLKGTLNQNTPTSTIRKTSIMPIAIYGANFPAISSGGFIGVDTTCSNDPLSFSLTTVRDVKVAAISIIIMAISPGTMKSWLSISALYHTLGSGT